MARRLVERLLGAEPRRVVSQTGGLSNYVFRVDHPEGDFVVRISPEPAGLHEFLKEQWAAAKARDVGIPTPEILEVGSEVVPYPYMISRAVAGREATFHPDRARILREMGRLGALVNSIVRYPIGMTFFTTPERL